MSRRPGTLLFVAELAQQETWPRQQLLDLQRRRLKAFVEKAVKESPYYRDIAAKLGRRITRLQDFPVLTKSILVAEYDRLLTDPMLSRAVIEKHLSEQGSGRELLLKYHVVPSGGFSGLRAMMVYDRTTRMIGVANMLRWLQRMGVSETTRVVGIGAATMIHVSNQVFLELRKTRPDAPALDVTMPIPELVAALNRYQPEVLITYPSILRELALEQLAGRLAIAPRCCSSLSEMLAPEVRRLAFEAWKAPIIDTYATTETGMIGTDCPEAAGIHLLEQLMIVEIVDENYRPVPNGTVGERMLVTPLFNPVLPLIRYEITDRVALATEPCRCGRPQWRLASIQGRREEMLDLPAKDGGILRIPPVHFRDPLLLNPGLRQYQIEARPDGLHIRVVLGADAGEPATALASLRGALLQALDQAGAKPAVTIEAVDKIERIGSSGKARLVARSH
ncbi:MAG TPA: phenylacetate--CoA ligase family protein [Hypericibacter adhaerens]|uniref:phenylacetate--CoA ligase family protein n=1 Tax=Hypericibacter adhaerens TaxID=2602016 RepID=UPI0017857327|nr:phenylacetate--CoA ligase family protein [Hypericibacter adhaerens]HWA42502.1 phenylacetate--CoA ligase family protein [Hypericibacter adhaerens]